MKKTFPVNINGYIFYIDEDAYDLLNTYLDQLHKAFPDSDGSEILSDIEARIAELFSDKVKQGAKVVVLQDVNDVISQMGSPSDISAAGDDSPSDDVDAAPDCDSSASTSNANTPPPFSQTAPAQPQARKRLYRDENDKVFGGVLRGLSHYTGWDVTLMRVIYALLALLTYFWPCVVIYLLAWMIIQPARTPRQILEMTGTPVTVGNIGQSVLGTANSAIATSSVSVSSVMSVVGKAIMAFIGVTAACGAFVALGVFLTAISCLLSYLVWGSYAAINFYNFADFANPILGLTCVMTISMAVIIPALALVWGGCCAVFNFKGIPGIVAITGIVIEVLLIISSIILFPMATFAN